MNVCRIGNINASSAESIGNTIKVILQNSNQQNGGVFKNLLVENFKHI